MKHPTNARGLFAGPLCVEFDCSQTRQRTVAICAKLTAGVDVKLPFAVSADRDFCLFPLSG
jgi:hypothetical protein